MFFLLLLGHSSFAQNDSWGREFYVSLFPHDTPQKEVYFHFRANEPSTVEVNFANKQNVNYDLPIGQSSFKLTAEQVKLITTSISNGGNDNTSAQIISDNKIIFAFSNSSSFSADATLATPLISAGHHYIVADDWEGGLNPPYTSQVNIIATGGKTVLKIIHPDGTEKALFLDAMSTYTIESTSDLTGLEIIVSKDQTIVPSNGPPPPPGGVGLPPIYCNPVIVYTGSQKRSFGHCPFPAASSHVVESLSPLSTIGTEYVLTPLLGRDEKKFSYSYMATEDNTTIKTTTQFVTTTKVLDKGEWFSLSKGDPIFIKADKPILVTQQASAQDGCSAFVPFNLGEHMGSPFSITLSPFEQGIEETVVEIVETEGIINQFLNIGLPTADVSNFSISPSPGAVNFTEIGTSGFSYATVSVEPNIAYRLKAGTGKFTVTEYGFGLGTSYGQNPFQNLNNLSFEVIINDQQLGTVKEDACLNSEIDFSINYLKPGLENTYSHIEWDFGDGTTAEGLSVTKTYDEAGLYRISAKIFTDEDICLTTHTLIREVEVHEIIAERIEGPTSLCPFSQNMVYTLIKDGDYFYNWEVIGGTIVGADNQETVTVNWGPPNLQAMVRVYVSDEFSCAIPAIELAVVLEAKDELNPDLPFGSTEVCFQEKASQIYYTPQITGATFEWHVEGGTITSGQNTNQIEVNWTQPNGKVSYTLFQSSCFGTSEELNVLIYEDLTFDIQTIDLSCLDADDGKASVSIQGGKAPYTISWSNGKELAPSVSGLAVGQYEVTVTDEIGCSLTKAFEITSPELLEASVEIIKFCNGEADGRVSIIPKGGTAPYTYHLYGSLSGNNYDETSNEPIYEGLLAGRYTLVVTDNNGCTSNHYVEIIDPEALELTVTDNVDICPQVQDGTISISVTGGTLPYTYHWSSHPNVNAPTIYDVGKGTYQVIVTDANGCTITREIKKEETYPSLFVPNIFTPDGDGINDTFKPISPCIVNYQITIFNRWGQPIFISETGGEWDGTQEGKDLPAGVYIYRIDYSDPINPELAAQTKGRVVMYK
ncbi:gliding motility-associated C-terminal domain-containing protein [Roseivirga sp.]|uniref:T9SS type B sorting domain-containing protein n=1 Tax=Roseivirga sp. TaxID=1964215 RepID=UPI002B272186|nr:gliding motility-associated C-terminal domain-containing protein [Roseivirga sp.]